MTYQLLIIDDDEDIRLILASILGTIPDLAIQTAATGQTGIQALQESVFNGVILDYLLPDATGEEILTFLQTIPPKKRPTLVMLSARADQAQHLKWQGLGARAIFVKPFNPMELVKALRTTLGF